MLQIKLGVVGQADSGKTVIVYGIQESLGKIDPGEGLKLGAIDHEHAKHIQQETKKFTEILRTQSSAQSGSLVDFEYALRQGNKNLLTITYHDSIGQLLELTSSQLDAQSEELHNKYLNNISKCNVLWAVIPVRIKEGVPDFDDSEIEIVISYISKAINLRLKHGNRSPFSLAVVISRIDIIGPYEESELKPAITELTLNIGRRFEDFVMNCSSIWQSAVFPVSAFGFTNYEVKYENTGDGNRDQRYYLSRSMMEPWNLNKLLLWSICTGLEQPHESSIIGRLPVYSRLAARIGGSLSQTYGPMLTIKPGRVKR